MRHSDDYKRELRVVEKYSRQRKARPPLAVSRVANLGLPIPSPTAVQYIATAVIYRDDWKDPLTGQELLSAKIVRAADGRLVGVELPLPDGRFRWRVAGDIAERDISSLLQIERNRNEAR